MALLMFVLKTSEDDQTVTYRYGDGPDELYGTVAIAKRTGRPVDEESLPLGATIALRAIRRGKRKAGKWPHRYMYAA